jgi:hypothetical protein
MDSDLTAAEALQEAETEVGSEVKVERRAAQWPSGGRPTR